MRYRGAGRSWWPILTVAVIAIVIVVAAYFLWFAPR